MFKDDDLDVLLPLGEVPSLLPRGRGGKPVHQSAVFRWCQTGLKGTRLRCTQVAGRRCTTRRWLNEFFDRLSEQAGLSAAEPVSARSPAKRERDHRQADATLDKAGW
ncbi:MAG: DUF1580 domain-containing protein [Planctomycetaceae bacterium]|nr:DUF1580 domain-containing protein [Planctomycetaceae bacterium]